MRRSSGSALFQRSSWAVMFSGGLSTPVTWPAYLPIPKPAAITQKLTHIRLPPGWLKSASASVLGRAAG